MNPLGANNVAAVLGMDPHKTALEVWFELTRRARHGAGAEPPEEKRRKRALERHQALESVCIEYGTEELTTLTGQLCSSVHLPTVSLPDHPWAVSTPRCAWKAGEELVLGVPKTMSGAEVFHKRWGQENTDQVSDATLIADQWHLLHHPNAERCFNPVLVGGWKFNFSWWMVDKDLDLGAMLLERAHAWYVEHVQGDKPPAAVPRDDALLSRLWSGRKDQSYRPDMEFVEIATEAKRLGIEGNRYRRLSDKLRTRLRELMADATSSRWGEGRKVTLSAVTPTKAANWQAIATELGAKIPSSEFAALVAKHTYEKLPKRTLRITIPGFEDDEDDDD